jgi:hypothetical protein
MHEVTASEQLAANDIKAAAAKADFARCRIRRRKALQNVADTED